MVDRVFLTTVRDKVFEHQISREKTKDFTENIIYKTKTFKPIQYWKNYKIKEQAEIWKKGMMYQHKLNEVIAIIVSVHNICNLIGRE